MNHATYLPLLGLLAATAACDDLDAPDDDGVIELEQNDTEVVEGRYTLDEHTIEFRSQRTTDGEAHAIFADLERGLEVDMLGDYITATGIDDGETSQSDEELAIELAVAAARAVVELAVPVAPDHLDAFAAFAADPTPVFPAAAGTEPCIVTINPAKVSRNNNTVTSSVDLMCSRRVEFTGNIILRNAKDGGGFLLDWFYDLWGQQDVSPGAGTALPGRRLRLKTIPAFCGAAGESRRFTTKFYYVDIDSRERYPTTEGSSHYQGSNVARCNSQ